MAFNFTDTDEAEIQELAGIPVSVPTRIESSSEGPAEDFEEVFSEAEKRFAKALFYRQLLVESPFDENDPIADQVLDEIRTFVRGRLATLLGVHAEVPKATVVASSDFTPEEIEVLRKVAGRLLKKPEIAQIEPAKAPVLKKVGAPKPLKKAEPAAAPVPPPPVATKKLGRPKGGKKSGEWLEVDGIRYEKVVGDERGDHYTDKEGQKYLVSTNPETGAMFMKNVTPAGVPSTYKPVPRMTVAMMNAVAAQQASQSLKNNEVAGLTLNTILTKSGE